MKLNKLLLLPLCLSWACVFTSCTDDEFNDMQSAIVRNVPYQFLEHFEDSVEYRLPEGITGADWMSKLPDNQKVCHTSIPGTHDALTGMGFYSEDLQFIFNMTAISQVSTLYEQLENGIRFFDIRPIVSTDLAEGCKVLRCTHGISEIDVTFEEALDIMSLFLKEHPNEFVIVKTQHDNGTENQVDWTKMMKTFLRDYNTLHNPGIFAEWRPDVTVGELRGKILFINRKTFDGMYGAHCEWADQDPDLMHPKQDLDVLDFDDYDWLEEELLVKANDQNDSTVMTGIYVQDYFKSNTEMRQSNKVELVLQMFDLARFYAQVPDDNTWFINHCSAYTSVSPRGYLDNAEEVHAAAILDLLLNPSKPVGIVAIDFACYDNVSCIINGYTPYTSDYLYNRKPMAQSLTNLLIMSNFK